MRLQSHKSVSAKVTSLRLWLQSRKKAGANAAQQSNELLNLYDCSARSAKQNLMGNSLSEVCQSQSSVWDLKGAGVQSMWLHVTNQWLINQGDQPVLVLPKHFETNLINA